MARRPIQLSEIVVNHDDILNSGWEEALATASKQSISSYTQALFSAAEIARKARKRTRQHALILLGCVAQMFFDFGCDKEPLKPMFSLGGKSSAGIGSFTEVQLDAMAAALPEITDVELRARIGDVLWLRRRDHHAGRIAVRAYLAAAEVVFDPEHWTHTFIRIQRATRIAAGLGKKSEEWGLAIAHVEGLLLEMDGTDPFLLTAKLIGLLLEQKTGNLTNLASMAGKAAVNAVKRKDFLRAGDYFQLQHHCLRKAGDAAGARNARLAEAEAYVSIGEGMFAERNPALGAAHWIEKAIHTLGRGRDVKIRRDQLTVRLHEMQKWALEQMQPIGSSMEVPKGLIEEVERARTMSFRDALRFLGFQARPTPMARLQQMVLEQRDRYLLDSVFGKMGIAEDGRTDYSLPTLPMEGPVKDDVLRLHAWHLAAQRRPMTGWMINAVRSIILDEHPKESWDFSSLLNGNPFIPAGRESLYARAIEAGLEGDMVVAVHLLCPQLESSFRHVLKQHGEVTTFINEGQHDEAPMTDLMRREKFEQVFGPDLTFDLRGLLIERAGSNLRNDTAHGFKSAESFNTYDCFYLFGITVLLLAAGKAHVEDEPVEPDE